MRKIEIGGGTRNLGGDWVNLDLCESADIQHDLNQLPWPLEDTCVDQVYTSHCIEHTLCPFSFVREICRVCKVGAAVEIRCPDAMNEMAMVAGHQFVFSVSQVRHMDVFPEIWWEGCVRRLRLIGLEPAADDYWFPKARGNPLFARWTDEEIMTWLPRTRHENRFRFLVEAIAQ